MTDDERDDARLSGYITKFDTGRNSGVINGKGGVQYKFVSSSFLEKIDDLMKTPGVSFELENGEAVRIRNDGTLPRIRQTVSSGWAILGAAKCPNCRWRLPILPDAQIPKFRKVKQGRCPSCNSTISLVSAVKGYHHIAAVGIIVIPAIARFLLGRSQVLMDEQLFASLVIISLIFYPIQIFLFFYLYFQEKFVRVKEVDIFE